VGERTSDTPPSASSVVPDIVSGKGRDHRQRSKLAANPPLWQLRYRRFRTLDQELAGLSISAVPDSIHERPDRAERLALRRIPPD
jgi:hypothetical protein